MDQISNIFSLALQEDLAPTENHKKSDNNSKKIPILIKVTPSENLHGSCSLYALRK